MRRLSGRTRQASPRATSHAAAELRYATTTWQAPPPEARYGASSCCSFLASASPFMAMRSRAANFPRGRVDVRVAAAARRLGLAEKARLRCGALGLLGRFQRAPHRGEKTRALRIQRVERAGAHQRFDDAPVDHALVDPPAEIEKVGE